MSDHVDVSVLLEDGGPGLGGLGDGVLHERFQFV
jgi:hypothetical protein